MCNTSLDTQIDIRLTFDFNHGTVFVTTARSSHMTHVYTSVSNLDIDELQGISDLLRVRAQLLQILAPSHVFAGFSARYAPYFSRTALGDSLSLGCYADKRSLPLRHHCYVDSPAGCCSYEAGRCADIGTGIIMGRIYNR